MAEEREGASPNGAGDGAAEGVTEAVEATVEATPDAGSELDKARREIDDWKGRAYRAAADLENLRKRFQKDREDLRKYGIEGLLKDLLPVADNLDRAVGAAVGTEGPIAEGVRMVLKQLATQLERHGAKPFDPKGEPFDPTFHEAMSQVERADMESGTVVEVFQRGWMLHDRLVRPAMVIISRAPAGQTPPDSTPESTSTEGSAES